MRQYLCVKSIHFGPDRIVVLTKLLGWRSSRRIRDSLNAHRPSRPFGLDVETVNSPRYARLAL